MKPTLHPGWEWVDKVNKQNQALHLEWGLVDKGNKQNPPLHPGGG